MATNQHLGSVFVTGFPGAPSRALPQGDGDPWPRDLLRLHAAGHATHTLTMNSLPLHVMALVLTQGDAVDLVTVPSGAASEWLGLDVEQSRLQPSRWAPRQPVAHEVSTFALLFNGVPGLTPGPVLTVGRDLALAGMQGEIHWVLGQHAYSLRWSGRQSDGCDAQVQLSMGGNVQILFDAALGEPASAQESLMSCDEPHLAIHWAGDLDRDGRLDLVVTFSRKYSYHPRVLMLSSKSVRGELIREAARWVRLAE